MNSTTFVNSTILTQEQGNALLNMVNLSSTSITAKIYSASINGFSATNFHSKCDNILGTLIIIKTLNSNIFGGFTLANWLNSGWRTDTNAFIFSLINQFNYPIRLNIINSSYAIYANSSLGPTFGNGNDIIIADQSNSNLNSYSNLGSAYQLPPLNMTYGSFAAQYFLAGSYNFQPIEIEVYSINCNLFFIS